MSRSDFLSVLNEHGDACLHAAQHLSNHLQSAVDLIRSIRLSHNMDERLAKFLLRWATQGHHTNGTVRVNLTMTHEEIAQSIGTSRETVTRLLAKLRHSRIAQIDVIFQALDSYPPLSVSTLRGLFQQSAHFAILH